MAAAYQPNPIERRNSMKVQDVMSENVKTCTPDTDLAAVAAIMWEGDCGVLPVVADGGKVVGVITDRDIAIALGTRNRLAPGITAGEVISGQVYACRPEDDIHTALKTIRKDKVRRLPVIDEEGRIQGILSMNDVVLQAEQPGGRKTVDLTYEDVVNSFKAICEHRHPKAEEKQTAIA
jgi:CBS domain-containing protein